MRHGKQHHLFQREKAARIHKQWVRLTRSCNNRCVFCLDAEAHNGTAFPFSKVTKVLEKGKTKGAQRAVLSGGEPTIHPRFLDIVSASKKIGYSHIQVISNGRMFAYKDFLKEAYERGINEITFSMHGHTPELHDRQTGVAGSFIQSLAGLEQALARNLIVSVDIVINQINVIFLADILRFFIGKGVTEFDLLQVIPFGNAWKNKKTVLYKIEEHIKPLREAFSFSLKEGLYIWTNRFPAQYLEGFEHIIQHPVKLKDEIEGRKKIFNKFLKHGIFPDCRGRRCAHCFLRQFCGDLEELVTHGVLDAYPLPFCLQQSAGEKHTASHKRFQHRPDVSIYEFLDFFIVSRYVVKGTRCRECGVSQHCPGAPVIIIHRYGFPKPIPAKPA